MRIVTSSIDSSIEGLITLIVFWKMAGTSGGGVSLEEAGHEDMFLRGISCSFPSFFLYCLPYALPCHRPGSNGTSGAQVETSETGSLDKSSN